MSETQVCTKCGVEQPSSQFSWKNQKKRKRRSMCKVCHSAYRRQHYLDNHEMYKEKARRWDKENRQEYLDKSRRYVLDYLIEHPCVDCGETNPIVLEFDHVRGKKVEAIAVLVKSIVTLERLQSEIDKCDVRCANCHRIKTAKEQGWHLLDLMAEYNIDI